MRGRLQSVLMRPVSIPYVSFLGITATACFPPSVLQGAPRSFRARGRPQEFPAHSWGRSRVPRLLLQGARLEMHVLHSSMGICEGSDNSDASFSPCARGIGAPRWNFSVDRPRNHLHAWFLNRPIAHHRLLCCHRSGCWETWYLA